MYNVSVQVVNSGGPSRSLTAAVRMVTVGQLGRTGVQYFLCFFGEAFRMLSFAGPFHFQSLVSKCIHPINVCSYSEMLLFSLCIIIFLSQCRQEHHNSLRIE